MDDKAFPSDLTAFLRALELGDERLRREHIAMVETAWEIPDTVVSSHGWVLALKGGRRVYIEYTLDDLGGTEDLTFCPLPPDEYYPTLHSDAGVFWYRPDHINHHLGLVGRVVH